MEESCSPLMTELDEVEKSIKNIIEKMGKTEEKLEIFSLRSKERDLEKKREEIVKQINACRSSWDVFY